MVGLGNPGSKYEGTRHNVGFFVIDLWIRDLGVGLTGRRFRARSVRTTFRHKEILLFCPDTFMNLSGTAVKSCADFYGLEPSHILVIHDDLDLPVGRVKVVRNGGAGGHRGVSSMVESLGDTAFPRVKIGIGRPRYGESIEDFVLSPFYEDEEGVIKATAHLAVRACALFVTEGVESAMNQINCQNLAENKEVNS
jgi:PTH1 family peptidyl-tRNA hydrolase